MDKPKGIKIIAILILVFSGISIFQSISTILTIALSKENSLIISTLAQLNYNWTYLLVSGILGLILDILFVISAIGLLNYKEWGRKGVIGIAIADIIFVIGISLYSPLSATSLLGSIAPFITIVTIVFSAAIYGLLIFYFNRKTVKEAFQ